MVNKYYQKHKEQLRKEARGRYQNLSKEGKDERSETDMKMFWKDKSRNYLSI